MSNDRRIQGEMADRILGQKNRTGAYLKETLASNLTTDLAIIPDGIPSQPSYRFLT
jgi:hypothetical protein